MQLLGHAGITLGAAALAAGAAGGKRGILGGATAWLVSLSRYLDIRFLLVGSMLPDIIDKPVGILIFPEAFQSGRIFSHTLLFVIVLAASGLFIYRKQGRTWMLALAAGSFMHLVLDEMWRDPVALFWPALGLHFEPVELENIWAYLWEALFTRPSVYIPELIGLTILLWLALTILFRRSTGVFLRYGKVR